MSELTEVQAQQLAAVAAMDQAGAAMGAVGEVAQRADENLEEWLRRITPIIQRTYDALYGEYRRGGAIYGETADGMIRWYQELGDITRHQAAIEEILERHRRLQALRKSLGENP